MRIDVGCDDAQLQSWKPALYAQEPEQCKGIRLLTRGATGAPAREFVPALRRSGFGKRRQHFMLEVLEHAAVAEKARDRDATKFIERVPFLAVVLEVRYISPQIGDAQLAQSSSHPLAYESAHLAIARPMQTEPREYRLQELDKVVIRHRCMLRLIPGHRFPVSAAALESGRRQSPFASG